MAEQSCLEKRWLKRSRIVVEEATLSGGSDSPNIFGLQTFFKVWLGGEEALLLGRPNPSTFFCYAGLSI